MVVFGTMNALVWLSVLLLLGCSVSADKDVILQPTKVFFFFFFFFFLKLLFSFF